MSQRDAFVAIADPTRREILDLLRTHGPLLAGEIAAEFDDASRPGISRHLRVLRECGVVAARARTARPRSIRSTRRRSRKCATDGLPGSATCRRASLKALRRAGSRASAASRSRRRDCGRGRQRAFPGTRTRSGSFATSAFRSAISRSWSTLRRVACFSLDPVVDDAGADAHRDDRHHHGKRIENSL